MSRRDDIVAAARDLLEADGEDALTMRAIADRLGIRAPSLYKHITDKAELEVALVAQGLAEQAELFEAALATAPDPVAAIAADYRSWAARHPHLYRLMHDRPLPRERLPEGLEMRAIAPVVTAVGGDRTRARAVWAFAHGMVSLELAGRFPDDADLAAAWAVGLAGITAVDTVGMDRTAAHEEGHRP
jgi:AcrR family transcriptional regulator